MMMFLIKIFNNYIFFLFLFMMMMILMLPNNFKKFHPLFLGILMLFYSILISLNMNMFNKSNIYSLMMYLIIIGGFLILFLYFNSFAINNKMIYNKNLLMNFYYKSFISLLMMILMVYKINLFNLLLFMNDSILEMKMLMNFNKNNNNFNIKMIYLKFNMLTIFFMLYLIYTLIIIVKLIFFKMSKSLRQLI